MIDIVRQRYPYLSTIGEIFEAAINTQDINTIRTISSFDRYLPITWNRYVDSPTYLLSSFSNRIDPVLLAYRMGNLETITQFPNVDLAIRYNIVPFLKSQPIDIQVQGLSIEDLMDSITTTNSYEYLKFALIYNRVDIVKYLIDTYGPQNLDLLLDKYKDSLSIAMVKYLLPTSPQLEDVLIDISQIESPYLSDIQVFRMFKFDMIDVYDKYGYSRISTMAYGNIRRRIIEKNTTQLEILSPGFTFEDILLGLQLYSENKDLRIFYLKQALSKGYMELLDRYMKIQDSLRLYIFYPSDELLDLFDTKYQNLGQQIEDGIMNENLVMAAIQDRNVEYLRQMIPRLNLPEHRMEKLQLVLQQYRINL